MNVNEPLKTCQNSEKIAKSGLGAESMRSLTVTCLLVKWHLALRWHEFYLGHCKELENLKLNVKGEVTNEHTS